jgi:hypothetical protein
MQQQWPMKQGFILICSRCNAVFCNSELWQGKLNQHRALTVWRLRSKTDNAFAGLISKLFTKDVVSLTSNHKRKAFTNNSEEIRGLGLVTHVGILCLMIYMTGRLRIEKSQTMDSTYEKGNMAQSWVKAAILCDLIATL